MSLKTYPKSSQEHVSTHFYAHNFDCPCGDCSFTFIDTYLIDLLEKLRAELGCPVFITHGGGYRCDRYQAHLGELGYETAPGRSTHQDGKASDLKTDTHTGDQLELAARKIGFRAVGTAKTWIHVDTRDWDNPQGRDRRWTYSN